ncbi:MAG: serine hydrolase [Lachnospiraceae bacterium]|nr:serine hydrolase [Lachnospiraceae bacterium]
MAGSLLCSSFMGCGKKQELKNKFDPYSESAVEDSEEKKSDITMDYIGENVAILPTGDVLSENVTNENVKSAAAFDVKDGKTLYAYNATMKAYPASMTKILTAYIVLKNCKLTDKVQVSENAVVLPPGAVSMGLKKGDIISVKGLLYGLMFESANDAALALAEHVSGSVEDFAKLMNKEAYAIGATDSNFVTPNGIHDENHYTTAYDMYLILNKAIGQEKFLKLIGKKQASVKITNEQGVESVVTIKNSNPYFNKKVETPTGYTVLGGKSGITNAAGNCYILLAKNPKGHTVIYVAMGAASGETLYSFLDQLMTATQ